MGDGNNGIDIAFCPLLWQANGGRLTTDGVPVIEEGASVRGNCRNPYDCSRCDILNNTLLSLAQQGVSSLWVCTECGTESLRLAKELGLKARLPGFYSEGYCQRESCFRATQGPEGRFSILLQLLTVVGPDIP